MSQRNKIRRKNLFKIECISNKIIFLTRNINKK